MTDETKTAEASADTLIPKAERPKPLARVQMVPWMIVIGLIALSAWLGWRAFFYQEEGDPVASAMLAFEKQNSLTVFSARFDVVAESEDRRGVLNIDLLKSRQAAIIPATVEYRIDLSNMDRDRFVWNDDTDTLLVVLPSIKISRPNLDEAESRVFTDGTWVTRNALADLSRNNSAQAERKAAAFAKNPELLALARQGAKDAVRQNLAIPLQVAGYGDVNVNVRFDGEKAPE